jgi:hypothetical protein
MNADHYLFDILRREAVDTGMNSPANAVLAALRPTIAQWANKFLGGIAPSGSFAKGTANKSGTDIDLFISLVSTTPESLKDIYNSLLKRLQEVGLNPKQQNVSINVRIGIHSVDLVPGKRQDNQGTDHSLYRRRAGIWTKTNVLKHIAHVRASNRVNEIRIIKLWRNQKGLDFPSFYLELMVIAALFGARAGTLGNLSANVVKVLEYLRDAFPNARFIDPANTNNIISDDMTVAERMAVQKAATAALGKTWGEFVT